MKVYITGGTGLVGSNVIKVAREKFNAEVVAPVFGSQPTASSDYSIDALDLRDTAAIAPSIEKHRPDVIIHCAALIDQVLLVKDHPLAWGFMVDSTRALINAANVVGARFIFISSDWVFDGLDATPATEDTPPCPPNYYGVLKVVGETLTSALAYNGAVARTAGVYGINYAIPAATRWEHGVGFGHLPNWVLAQLRASQPVDIWTSSVNVEANPTLASDLADLVLLLAESKLKGIYHCCGSELISRLALAQAVAAEFALDATLIQETPPDPAVVAELDEWHIRLPYRGRLDTRKTAAALGRSPLNVRDGLRAFKGELAAAGL